MYKIFGKAMQHREIKNDIGMGKREGERERERERGRWIDDKIGRERQRE